MINIRQNRHLDFSNWTGAASWSVVWWWPEWYIIEIWVDAEIDEVTDCELVFAAVYLRSYEPRSGLGEGCYLIPAAGRCAVYVAGGVDALACIDAIYILVFTFPVHTVRIRGIGIAIASRKAAGVNARGRVVIAHVSSAHTRDNSKSEHQRFSNHTVHAIEVRIEA